MDTSPEAAPRALPPAASSPQSAKKPTVDQIVAEHVTKTFDMPLDKVPAEHRLVTEHAEEAQLEPWQMRTLLARFHAHGLRHLSRIHPDVFKAALDEALHGRI